MNDNRPELPRVTASPEELAAHKQPEADSSATEAQRRLIVRLVDAHKDPPPPDMAKLAGMSNTEIWDVWQEELTYADANKLIGWLRKRPS